MSDIRPLIFISNDDGFRAKGINELISVLKPQYDIIIVAPDSARSGASCAITSAIPVNLKMIKDEPGLKIYSCSGTPVDCVKLGLQEASPRRPDLIIGGINHGENDGPNVHYSGTMGIVMEGCMKGIPSIGFSLQTFDSDADFSDCLPYCSRIVAKAIERGIPQGVCLNVNFPYGQPIRGIRICTQARGLWTNEWKKVDCPRGGSTYWLVGDYSNTEPESEAIDDWAMRQGYAAITPIQVDMTAYSAIQQLKDWHL